MGMIYHILHEPAWQMANTIGTYRGDTLDIEGFIHCSTRAQVTDTAARYFRGDADLVLLEINGEKISAPVRYEKAANGEMFPHIYGPLNLDAVIRALPFPPKADGSFIFPEEGAGEG